MDIFPFFPTILGAMKTRSEGLKQKQISSCDKSDKWLIVRAVRARWCCTVGSHMCRTAWWIRLADGNFWRLTSQPAACSHPWTYSESRAESMKEEGEETMKCICTRCERASQIWVWGVAAEITSTHVEPAWICVCQMCRIGVFKPQKIR